jgi:hypothetical protein
LLTTICGLLRAVVGCLLLVTVFPWGGSAQSRLTGADLEGIVRDESGAVTPGATITVTNHATNLTRAVVTDHLGRFIVPALAPGTYAVAAELAGFAGATHERVSLHLGQLVSLAFTLKVAAASQQVEVVADAPLLDVRDTSVSEVIGGEQIESLPTNGRNFISFAVIAPGVARDNTPQQGAAATSGLSFAGQRARSNNIMVDGLDNNDLAVGGVRAVFSQEAIREFQVLTNSYSAEFGKASGGVVNIVTKSGTNAFHGNAFGYFRDAGLNARNHFEQFDSFGDAVQHDKAPFSQNQYGATFGGPIRRQETFFFTSFERFEQNSSNLVTIDRTAADILTRAGFSVVPGANPYAIEHTQLLGKIDQQWKPGANVVVRVNYSDGTNENIEPFGGLVAKSRGAIRLVKDWSSSASQTNVFGGRWVNEARIQHAYQDQKLNSLDPNCGGSCLSDDQGGPTLEVTGVASVGRQRVTPQPRLSNRVQAVETVSFFAGNHQIKGGIDFNWIRSRDAFPFHFGGRYIFAALPFVPGVTPRALSAIEAVEFGFPAAYIQGTGHARSAYGYKDLSVFVQDEWRINSRVTLKPGLRYQIQFWPGLHYDISDVNGTRLRYPFPHDRNNVAPRLALSLDPTGTGRTAFRASYGMFYDNHVTATVFITDAIDGTADGVRTLAARFPSPIVQTAWNAPGHRLSDAQTQALIDGGSFPSTVLAIDPGLKTPYAHHASAGIEHTWRTNLAASASFIHVRGAHQLATLDYNPIVPALGPNRRPNDVNGIAGTSASVLQYSSFGDTWYRGLVATISKRNSEGNHVLASYTFSKAEDNSADFPTAFIPQDNGLGRNPRDPRGVPLGFNADLERGPAIWDERHRLVISGAYRAPRVAQFSAIVTAASGRPYTPLAGVDLNGDGNGGVQPPDRARRVPGDPATSVARNSERLPSQFSVDVRISRRFAAGRALVVEPMLEAFNLFNRTNFTEANNVFGTGAFPSEPARDANGRVTYGLFTQAQPPRQVQLAIKLSF